MALQKSRSVADLAQLLPAIPLSVDHAEKPGGLLPGSPTPVALVLGAEDMPRSLLLKYAAIYRELKFTVIVSAVRVPLIFNSRQCKEPLDWLNLVLDFITH